jgi:hypothetical protein
MPASGDRQTKLDWHAAEYVQDVENGDATLLPPGVQVVKRSSQ